MPVRNGEAIWEGTLREGKDTLKFGAFEGPYSFASRFEDGSGTNPEELIGAAHAGCFSMALSSGLTKAGFTPTRIQTTARVHLEKVDDAQTITRVELSTEALIPDINEETFMGHANTAKETCPVSRALAGVEVILDAKLVAG
jgi:osmotically inducible protein OsmC